MIFRALFPRRKHKRNILSILHSNRVVWMSLHGSHRVFKASPFALTRFERLIDSLRIVYEIVMAEVAPAPAAAAPAKAAKKKAAPRPKKVGPSVGDLIVKAVAASKERSGVSLAALKKALVAGGYDVEKNKARVKTAVKGLVTKGTLVQVKGTGASGSFKINKAKAEKAKKPAKKAVKKVAAKKPAAAKKPKKVAAKKPAAKKSPKKAKKPATPKKAAKSPKKAKKPAAPKKVAAKKSPKKAVKPKAAKPKAAKAKKAAPKKK